MLDAKLTLFLDPDYIGNTTELNADNYMDLYSEIIKARGSSALWFYPACVSIYLSLFLIHLTDGLLCEQGLTIIGLVVMSLIKGLPRGENSRPQLRVRLGAHKRCLIHKINGNGESSPTDLCLAVVSACSQLLMLENRSRCSIAKATPIQ